MGSAKFTVGDTFRIQFVWRIPNQDFLRAIFDVKVLHQDTLSNKYVVHLDKFLAGRQESSEGEMRPSEEISRDYWTLISELAGRRISVAYEVEDGRPLWLRLETLTGEHNFFSRLDELPKKFSTWNLEQEGKKDA
jgi:hypothetical protein